MARLPTKSFSVGGETVEFAVVTNREKKRIKSLGAERGEILRFRSDVAEDEVVWDIGGNIGLYTVFTAPVADQIHAFEPEPKNIERLKENVSINGFDNVTVHGKAISSEKGTIELDVTGTQTGGGAHHITEDGDVEVETVRADDLDIERPSVIKVDVEGAEYGVFEGMEEILNESVRLCYVEVHDEFLKERFDKTGADVLKQLRDAGFSCKAIDKKYGHTMYRAEK
jgi:FkbM family methyltransferase